MTTFTLLIRRKTPKLYFLTILFSPVCFIVALMWKFHSGCCDLFHWHKAPASDNSFYAHFFLVCEISIGCKRKLALIGTRPKTFIEETRKFNFMKLQNFFFSSKCERVWIDREWLHAAEINDDFLCGWGSNGVMRNIFFCKYQQKAFNLTFKLTKSWF